MNATAPPMRIQPWLDYIAPCTAIDLREDESEKMLPPTVGPVCPSHERPRLTRGGERGFGDITVPNFDQGNLGAHRQLHALSVAPKDVRGARAISPMPTFAALLRGKRRTEKISSAIKVRPTLVLDFGGKHSTTPCEEEVRRRNGPFGARVSVAQKTVPKRGNPHGSADIISPLVPQHPVLGRNPCILKLTH